MFIVNRFKGGVEVKDFVSFVREQGVVGMAVGLAIGLQATVTVQAIVSGFIDPLVGWFLGMFMENPDNLKNLDWVIVSGSNPLVISWGFIASAIITFFAVVFVVYFFVKKAGLDKLDKKAS